MFYQNCFGDYVAPTQSLASDINYKGLKELAAEYFDEKDWAAEVRLFNMTHDSMICDYSDILPKLLDFYTQAEVERVFNIATTLRQHDHGTIDPTEERNEN